MIVRTIPVILAFLAGASQPSAQSSGSPLLERSKQYQAAMAARDAAKVASFYTDDAVTMAPNSPPMKGRKAIEADLRKQFEQFPDVQITGTPVSSEVAGDLGYVHGTFVTKAKAFHIKGSYVEVWKRVGGEWKIAYDIWNSSEPAPAPPTPPVPPTPPIPPTAKQ